MDITELETDQLDMVILAQINAHHFSGELIGQRTEEERQQRNKRMKDYTVFSIRTKVYV